MRSVAIAWNRLELKWIIGLVILFLIILVLQIDSETYFAKRLSLYVCIFYLLRTVMRITGMHGGY